MILNFFITLYKNIKAIAFHLCQLTIERAIAFFLL